MRKRTKAIALQVPAITLLVIAFLGSLIAKMSELYPLSWGTPVVLAIIVGLYFWGRVLEADTEILKH